MKNLTQVIALILTFATSAEAQDVHIIGPGAGSCGTWTANHWHEGNLTQVEDAWILGFLSGVGYIGKNAFGKEPLHGVDADAVIAWMTNYCAAHPLNQIAEAGAAFVDVHPH